jgi:hypothetical protein
MSYLAASSMQRDSTMTEDQLKFPQWQEPLRLAILEHDPVVAAEKTEQIERMLRERLQHLRATDADRDASQRAEEQAIIDALNVIRILRNNLA